MNRYFHDIIIALESILTNKLKSILTALGIIFGVMAVITMLAIGKGAQQEILDQIKMVGVNNIIITPIVEGNGENSDEGGEKQVKKFSPGLTLEDVEAIEEYTDDEMAMMTEKIFRTDDMNHPGVNAFNTVGKIARPSSPSVRLTAFALPATTRAANSGNTSGTNTTWTFLF